MKKKSELTNESDSGGQAEYFKCFRDIKVDGVREEDTEERVRWRHMVCKGGRKLGKTHNWYD